MVHTLWYVYDENRFFRIKDSKVSIELCPAGDLSVDHFIVLFGLCLPFGIVEVLCATWTQ
jgi:hypothetical protein